MFSLLSFLSQHMVLPTDRESQLKRKDPTSSASTRKAGGRVDEDATPTVSY